MKFEVISKYAEAGINLPQRSTTGSAGHDFEVAEDIVVPSILTLQRILEEEVADIFANEDGHDFVMRALTLDEMAALTKKTKAKPTLVPTGIKCELNEPNTYLELSVRSSCPLKHWLILANGVGVIDADYYNNPDNEGHIYFQIINLSPYDIQLRKGDKIGQGIVKPYLTMDNDSATGKRVGGFGSTSNG
jgi:dUTP pyrophosphatase